MTHAPHATIAPFDAGTRGIDEPNQAHAALREAGPIVRADAPGGGWMWIITDDALARQALADPRLAKDPALAPESWDPRTAGVEATAAAQMSLTTSDGPVHAMLRQAHAPLLSARRVHDRAERIAAIARDLLAELAAQEGTVDLMADFTTRFPLTVLFELLGVPLERLDEAAAACKQMISGDPAQLGMAIGALARLSGAALDGSRDGLAGELRDRLPAEVADSDVQYLLFTLLFAGQLTSDAALGVLLAHVLHGGLDEALAGGATIDEFVQDVLRRHPPAPYTLWRFTTTEVELGGVRLPARSPVLVDILSANLGTDRPAGQDLTFGAGAHYCIGAQLAQLELCTAVEVLRADFPRAALAVPFAELRQTDIGGNQGSRLTSLPVRLRG